MQTTIDGLLNRLVTLEQPAEGYRVAIDTVFLAAAVPVRAGEKVLELGCGAGGALLCLACRMPGIAVTGLEIDEELAELGRKNIARNKFAADLEVKIGDATVPLFENAFDHVMMNPPYHEESRHDVSGHAQKRKANSERDGDLELWIAHAAKALKLGGTLTLIHRADREAEILQLLKRDFGTVEILALLPKVGQAAKRVIVRTHKDAQAGNAFKREFVLHKPDGGFTEEADAILRHAKALLQ